MRKIIQLALAAGLIVLSGFSARAQSPSGYLHYDGRGDYSISGRQISEPELHDLIGDSLYYETYLPAQKQRRIGLPIGIVGASLLAATGVWYAVAIDAPWIHEKDVVISSAIAGGIGLVASAGLALHFIGNGRLKWIAQDYNRRNGYAADFDFGATRYGIGFTVHF